MPSYIAHGLMGKNLYQEIQKSNRHAKIPINQGEVEVHSLGIDLSILSKKTKTDPANSLTGEFFIEMARYIKEHGLIENSGVISLLYGHIAHYFLDTNTHPLIYYIEKGTQSVGPITNHDLVEGYINSYLTKQILGQDIMDTYPDFFNQLDLSNKEESSLLNEIYGSLYGDPHITKSYKKFISIFSMIETLIKKGRISKEALIQLSRFRQYLERNGLSEREITNEDHGVYTNPVTGSRHTESILDLYYRAISMTLDAIEEVNKYLYDGYPITILNSVFTGLSYDTGVDCKLGKNMVHVRKRVNPASKDIIYSTK